MSDQLDGCSKHGIQREAFVGLHDAFTGNALECPECASEWRNQERTRASYPVKTAMLDCGEDDLGDGEVPVLIQQERTEL